MVADWALEELGPRAFEQLAVALAVTLIGPDIEVYGSGKDGGREATYRGPIRWADLLENPQHRPNTVWTGYTVVQAKQHERLESLPADLKWLKGQITSELNAWHSGGRHPLPRNLLFVTNVRLSAVGGTGGVDLIKKHLDEQLDKARHDDGKTSPSLREQGISTAFVWHRDILNALIANCTPVRTAFPALLTAGDILERVRLIPGQIDPDQFAPILLDYTVSALIHEQYIRFDDAGDRPESRHRLSDIFVDLPHRDDAGQRYPSVTSKIIERADQVLRIREWALAQPRHLVITGAPGNGKSTLARFVTQLYRAHFVTQDSPSPATGDLIDHLEQTRNRVGIAAPASKRWPVRVSLTEMATDMGPEGGPNIRRWLCDRLSLRASIQVQPIAFDAWIKTWPVLLVFDGLDEVTAPAVRHRIIDEIAELVDYADTVAADIFIIITTRRTGYTERIQPDHLEQIDLDTLTLDEAIDYGTFITEHRLFDEEPHRNRILSRFRDAARNPVSQRLLQTPLQVLIMTITLGSTGSLPTTRYLLFWRYFDTIFNREADKDTTFRAFFRDHREDITELHKLVGLALQIDCETSGEVRARLPRARLQRIALEMMRDNEHPETDAQKYSDTVYTVATQRLVLLSTDEGDTVSFDVRSLQELMAGCALTDGTDDQISFNLNITARSAHWRNSWLFAAGRLFSINRYKQDMLVSLIEQCDESDRRAGWLYPAGPELASDVLTDGLAAANPRAVKRLIEVAVRCVNGPVPLAIESIASGLAAAADQHPMHRTLIRNIVVDAQASTGVRQSVARMIMSLSMFGNSRMPGSYTEKDLRLAIAIWRKQPARSATHPDITVLELITDEFENLSTEASDQARTLVGNALLDCARVALVRTSGGELWPRLRPELTVNSPLILALDDDEAIDFLDILLGSIDPRDWPAKSLLAQTVGAYFGRMPVGYQLKVHAGVGALAEIYNA